MRVLEEGEVGAGDIIERVELGPEQVTVREIHHLLNFDKKNVVGASKGNTIVQNRRIELRQSIEAASSTDLGMPCSPDRKKMKFTLTCFQTEIKITTKAASKESSL